MPQDVTVRRRSALLPVVVAAAVLAPPAGAALPLAPGSAPPLSSAVVAAPQPVALVAAAAAAPAADPAAARRVGDRVRAALAGSGARTVAAAVDVDGLGRVHSAEAGHALPPASTQKTYVSSAALLALGPDHRLRTEVARTATPSGGVLRGSLWLVAGGDPYLTRPGLRALAREVRAAGITTVTGDLLLDDSRYDALRRNEGWKPSFVPGQTGPLSAMAVDRNRWRRDAAFLRDPALPAAVLFRDALRAEGVTVRGVVRRERRPGAAVPVAQRVSGPLSAVARRMMKDSDNFAAELLLKEVGRVVRGQGTTAGGLAAVSSVLGERGVPVGAGTDGSGLSARNRQTPDGQVALLAAVADSPAAAHLRASLPVACVDGTLRRRLCGTDAAGNAAAKTGTLSGVTTLAGYVTTRSGRTARYAFQLTGVPSSSRARAAIDRAVAALAASPE